MKSEIGSGKKNNVLSLGFFSRFGLLHLENRILVVLQTHFYFIFFLQEKMKNMIFFWEYSLKLKCPSNLKSVAKQGGLKLKEQFQSLAKSAEVDFPSPQKVHTTSLGVIFDSWSIGDLDFLLRQLLPCQIKHFLLIFGIRNPTFESENFIFMLGVLILRRPRPGCTTARFKILMDQKKCFHIFLGATSWICGSEIHATMWKFSAGNQHFWSKIGQNSYFWTRFSYKINRKCYRSDGNRLFMPDSSLGRKLQKHIFNACNCGWKLGFWSKMKLENRVSEGVCPKFLYISKGPCINFILRNFDERSTTQLGETKKRLFLDWKRDFWSNHELENMVPEEVWEKFLKISKSIYLNLHPSNFGDDSFSELEEIQLANKNIFPSKKIFS